MDGTISETEVHKGWTIYTDVSYACDILFYAIAGITSIVTFIFGNKTFVMFCLMTILPTTIMHIFLFGFFRYYYSKHRFFKIYVTVFTIGFVFLMAVLTTNAINQNVVFDYLVHNLGQKMVNKIFEFIMLISIIEIITFKMTVKSLSKEITSYVTDKRG